MSEVMPHLPTVGEIARRCEATFHQVDYVIRTRRIEPAGMAGNSRVFTEADVAHIASELKRIAADRGGNL